MRRSGYGAVGRQSCRGHPREVTTGGLSGNAMGRQPWAQGKTSCRDGQGRRGRCHQRRQLVDTVSRSEGTGCRGRRMGCNGWSGRGSERVTRAGGRSILGGQGKEFRGQQRRLLCQSRGTGSTRPGSGSVSGRSVARRNEPERPDSALASAMSRSQEASPAVTVRAELRLTPSWVPARRERRDTA